MIHLLHPLTLCALGIAVIFNSLTMRNIMRRNSLMLDLPRKGRAFLTITDGTSGARTYWNPSKGCCDVRPIYFPVSDVEKETERAKAFYNSPCTIKAVV